MSKRRQHLLLALIPGFAAVVLSPSRPASGLGFSEIAKLANPGSPTAGIFGNALALSSDGSTAVVTAPVVSTPSGSGYVYARPAGGWPQVPAPAATLHDPTLPPKTVFGLGAGVSSDGSVIAIVEGNTDQGEGNEILLFARPDGGWSGELSPAARLSATLTLTEFFSLAVAISEDKSTIAAGQPATGTNAGLSFVYTRPAGGWTGTIAPAATLQNAAGQSNDYLGLAVAVSADGSIVCVGSPGLDSKDAPKVRGFAFVFARPPAGWSGTRPPTATLTDPAGEPGDFFGFAVAMTPDGASITASGAYQQPPGKLFVFARPAAGWTGNPSPAATLIPSTTTTASEIFVSAAVAQDGSRILGGRIDAVTGGIAGIIDVFSEPSGGWRGTVSSSTSVSAPKSPYQQGFGYPLSMDGSGTTFLTGDFLATLHENSSDNAIGDVFIFQNISPARSNAAGIRASTLAICHGR